MKQFRTPRQILPYMQGPSGRIQAGVLRPILMERFLESEGGIVQQTCTVELEKIAGRLITDVRAHLLTIFVPDPAMDALKNPEDNLPGNSDAFRKKLLEESTPFPLEAESAISKAARINPISISGTKYVSEEVALAYNVAVNYYRRLKYVKATQLTAANRAITPALFSSTILERYDGVLDPEDRVNGAVAIRMPAISIPVSGIGRLDGGTTGVTHTSQQVLEPIKKNDGAPTAENDDYKFTTYPNSGDGGQTAFHIRTGTTGIPQIFADLEARGESVSLTDFYQAERMDKLVRVMRNLIDKNPEYGEKLAAHWAAGLSIDTENDPMVVYDKEVSLNKDILRGFDGPSLDVEQTENGYKFDYAVPVPKTEFGGVLVTMLAIKPDEVVHSQPHPRFTKARAPRNFVADEIALDPVPVNNRQLFANIAQADEETRSFYVGNNHIEKSYMSYGWAHDVDQNEVAAKNAIWQLEVPSSVTADNILLPVPLDIYPFEANAPGDNVATYTATSLASIASPLILGPTPVEELAVIEEQDLFEDLNEE